MTKYFLEKISNKEDLTLNESYSLMEKIMNGELNNSHLAGMLLALRTKGETATELAGFVMAMKDKCIKIASPSEDTIDLCGTGGDYSGSFNISTAASFAAAGAGIHVAKHGNKSISSKCGSADVLKQLGINISLSPGNSEKALNEIGIAFLFAPVYHPSMKNAAPVRNELGVKTIFNLLGPLTNPAGTKKQLIGTFSRKASVIMCEASTQLGMKKVCFVNSADKFDEISLIQDTDVDEFSVPGGIKHYTLNNEAFGFGKINPENIKGSTPADNAAIILNVLREKEKNDPFMIIAANAAMALYCADYSSDLSECTAAAEESILSGKAYEKLKLLRDFGERV